MALALACGLACRLLRISGVGLGVTVLRDWQPRLGRWLRVPRVAVWHRCLPCRWRLVLGHRVCRCLGFGRCALKAAVADWAAFPPDAAFASRAARRWVALARSADRARCKPPFPGCCHLGGLGASGVIVRCLGSATGLANVGLPRADVGLGGKAWRFGPWRVWPCLTACLTCRLKWTRRPSAVLDIGFYHGFGAVLGLGWRRAF